MRFLVEVHHDAAGRITGTVAHTAGPPQPFDGWLDLARLLETRAEQHTSPDDGAGPPSNHARVTPAERSEVHP